MKYNPFDHNILIVGDSGSGKSNFLRYFIHKLDPSVPFWVWDYNRQHRYPKTVYRLEDLGYFRAVVQPSDLSPENFERFLNMAEKVGNIVVAIEETQEYESPHKLIGGNFFRAARNKGATYIALTQRPAELNKAIVSNAHHRFVFRLTVPSDVDALMKWIHPAMEQVRSLPSFYYLYHSKLDGLPPVKMRPVPFTEAI